MKFYKINPYSEIHGSFTKGQERKKQLPVRNYLLSLQSC